MESLSALPKEIQDLILKKDQRIKELEERVATLEKEKDDIVDNFQTSTEILLERIKDLESVSLGARPQTANILNRIENSRIGQVPEAAPSSKNHNYFVAPPQEPGLEENKGTEPSMATEMTKCTNCGELINASKMVTHTVACYRSTTKCKVCGERLQKSMKSEHLMQWRNNSRIISSIEKDDEAELTLILDHGIDAEHCVEKKTLLHLCALNNANDCLLLLISRGADTDPVDEQGCTPLLLALQKNNKKAAASLIELGANIECKDRTGKTPLMLACQNGNKEVFETLIKCKANIHATTPLGDTALAIAQKSGFQELALALVQNGASIRNKRPKTTKVDDKPVITP